jgi:hypothetical protein
MAGYISNDKCSFDVVAIMGAVVFDFVMPVAAEMIETETVGVQVDDVEQPGFERDKLGRIHLALEDRVLDALAVIEAGLGGAAQAGFSGGGGGRHVIGDQDIHTIDVADSGGNCGRFLFNRRKQRFLKARR